MRRLPESPFQQIIGLDLLINVPSTAARIVECYCDNVRHSDVKSIGVTLNDFYINPGNWYLQFYSAASSADYDPAKEYDIGECWLYEFWAMLSREPTGTPLSLGGCDVIKAAYQEFETLPYRDPRRTHWDRQQSYANSLVELRTFELVQQAHRYAALHNSLVKKADVVALVDCLESFYISRCSFTK